MDKTTLLAAALGLLATGTLAAGPVMAQSAPAHPATPHPAPAPSTAPAHQDGMDHGGQQMHDRMMSDHQAGTNKPAKPGHASGTPKPAAPKAPAMSDKPKDDCCMGGMPMPKDKPADRPMGHM